MNGIGSRKLLSYTLRIGPCVSRIGLYHRATRTLPFRRLIRGYAHSMLLNKDSIEITQTTASNTNNNSNNTNKSFSSTKLIPRKAAVQLTNEARTFLKSLLDTAMTSNPDIVGIGLNYQISKGTMKMVFQFDFIKEGQIGPQDEGVSLEVLSDGTPKPPSLSQDDGLPKLYIHSNAFLKVLGGKLDIQFQEDGSFLIILYDKEGNVLDPNA